MLAGLEILVNAIIALLSLRLLLLVVISLINWWF